MTQDPTTNPSPEQDDAVRDQETSEINLLAPEEIDLPPIPNTGGGKRKMKLFFPGVPYGTVGKDHREAVANMEKYYGMSHDKEAQEQESEATDLVSASDIGKQTRKRYDFHVLRKGDACFYPSEFCTHNQVKAAAMKWGRMHGIHFNVRKVKAKGTTVWRMK